jgi:putative ABC transport system substrate-binding protein
MNKIFRIRFFDSYSGNLKSKTCPFDKLRAGSELCRRIENPKWIVIVAIAITFAMCGAVAHAQQPKKIPRIGWLSARFPADSSASERPNVEGFRQGLRALGYVEGQNIVIEWRFAEGNLDRLPALAAELVALKVDLIVALGTPASRAAKQKTTTIPIVVVTGGDPVETGLVASLARPGGNVTGLTNFSQELNGKRLELLKEVVPTAARVGVLHRANTPGVSRDLSQLKVVAQGLGIKIQSFDVAEAGQLDSKFSAMTQQRLGGLMVQPDPSFDGQRKRIIELAVKSRLPAMYAGSEWTRAGGLVSYMAGGADLYRRAAIYVDKILKGTKPADLPVERPMRFEFVINLNAAKQIGLTVPPNVLVRADKVIR